MKIPEMRENMIMFFERKIPNMLAEAPREIKTTENPKIKDSDVINILFITSLPIPCSRSFRETPEIYDIYPGIIGRIQGDRKDKTPAIKATTKETFSM